jgi:type IV pilus assembly protein PilP
LNRHRKQGKKYYSILSIVVMVFLLGLWIGGCSKSTQAPSTTTPIAAKAAQKPVSQATATVAVEKPEAAYSYNPVGRRDPFAPIVVREEKKAKAGDRPPLERYNLFDFKLTAILRGGFGDNAMVEAPDGKGYVVHVGTIIGPNKGVVKKITENKLIVEEKFKNFSGGSERKEIVIELRKKQEERQ